MSDKKLNWLLDKVDIHDVSLKHEVFRAVQDIYLQANEATKAKLIESIKAHKLDVYEGESEGERKAVEAKIRFNWFHWLSESHPECRLAKDALEEVQAQYPDEQPSPHPDLSPWVEEAGFEDRGSWLQLRLKADDLISKPIDEWLEELLGYNEDWNKSPGPIEKGYLIRDLIEKDIERSFELARELAKKEKWETSIWGSLINYWGEADLNDKAICGKVLNFLEEEKIYLLFQFQIARFLYKIVENGGKEYALEILDRLNEIGIGLLKFTKDKEVETGMESLGSDQDEAEEAKGFDFSHVLNQSGGQLGLFFVRSIEIWHKSLESKPNKIEDEYRVILSKLMEKSLSGLSALASQFHYLQYVDKEWTEENLLPCFDKEEKPKQYPAAWGGFLFWGNFNPEVADALAPMFLKAVPNLEKDFANNKDRFIEFYVYMMTYFVDDPLTKWVPSFLQSATKKTQERFTTEIRLRLMDMEEGRKTKLWQRWLKQYWENRLSGRPAIISSQEAAEMAEWVSHLSQGGLFSEAVQLAIQMPAAEGYVGYMLEHFSKDNQAALYPEDMARLLIYLGSGGGGIEYGLRRYAPDIIKQLPLEELPPDLKRKLEELQARLS